MTTPATFARAGRDRPARWVDGLVSRASDTRFELLSATVPDALALDAGELEDSVRRVYLDLVGEQRPQGMAPLRIWNFIPGILEPLGELRHRYMAFNAGRHRAYERLLGSAQDIPVASGTGAAGTGLVVHCLFATDPGEAVENPRQIPAYHYSELWGPRPPSFARARRVDLPHAGATRSCLVVAGTASIVGEETLHGADLDDQLAEIERNLDALAAAAGRPGGAACARFRDVRVYVPAVDDLERVERGVERRFVGAERIEILESDLCRPGLRVEIEGVAVLDRD